MPIFIIMCPKNLFSNMLTNLHIYMLVGFGTCCCYNKTNKIFLYANSRISTHFSVLSLKGLRTCFLLKSFLSESTFTPKGCMCNFPVQRAECRALTHSEHSTKTLWSPAIFSTLSELKMKIFDALWVMSKLRLRCLWCLKLYWNHDRWSTSVSDNCLFCKNRLLLSTLKGKTE